MQYGDLLGCRSADLSVMGYRAAADPKQELSNPLGLAACKAPIKTTAEIICGFHKIAGVF